MTTKPRIAGFAAVALFAAAFAAPAFAHNLVLEAYAVGGGKAIEGDAFFSDGTIAKNATIDVTDDGGNPVDQVTTDDKGNFSYTPKQPVNLHFHLDLGSGHVANVVIAASKLAGGPSGTTSAAAAAGAGVDAATQDRISQMVANEIGPLNDEIERYKTHNDQLNLIAAIGLLCGFGGVLLFSAGAALAKSGQPKRTPASMNVTRDTARDSRRT